MTLYPIIPFSGYLLYYCNKLFLIKSTVMAHFIDPEMQIYSFWISPLATTSVQYRN
jgi:hypothetical protein